LELRQRLRAGAAPGQRLRRSAASRIVAKGRRTNPVSVPTPCARLQRSPKHAISATWSLRAHPLASPLRTHPARRANSAPAPLGCFPRSGSRVRRLTWVTWPRPVSPNFRRLCRKRKAHVCRPSEDGA